MLGPRSRQSRRLILTILTGYRPKSREMAANTSSSRLPRPWTSDGLSRYCPFAEFSRVAGVDAPAFVERLWINGPPASLGRVSPGLTLRPSLSADRHDAQEGRPSVSPGLTLRPSLSACILYVVFLIVPGVAGVDAPAFVERARRGPTVDRLRTCVAGVDAPAFVERARRRLSYPPSCSGVAGVDAPAFVERSGTRRVRPNNSWCRRG